MHFTVRSIIRDTLGHRWCRTRPQPVASSCTDNDRRQPWQPVEHDVHWRPRAGDEGKNPDRADNSGSESNSPSVRPAPGVSSCVARRQDCASVGAAPGVDHRESRVTSNQARKACRKARRSTSRPGPKRDVRLSAFQEEPNSRLAQLDWPESRPKPLVLRPPIAPP